MAGGRTQKNKAHKTRFSSKASRNAHKIAGEKVAGKGPARAIPSGEAARALRLQRNKNIRHQKRAGVLAEKRASSSPSSAPRILALVALSSRVSLESIKDRILSACTADESKDAATGQSIDIMDLEESIILANKDLRLSTVSVPRYKLRLTVITAPREDLQACLEVAKVADIVAFVAPAVGTEDGYVDPTGKKCLSMLRAQGFPVTTGLLVGLADVALKKQSEAKKSATAALQVELPEDTKIFSSDTADECQQVLRYLAEQRLSSPQWRTQRPYVVAQKLEFVVDSHSPERGTLHLSGYMRARGLSVNQLVHVAGLGDFQLSQIDILEDPCPLRQRQRQLSSVKGDSMLVGEDFSISAEASSISIFPNTVLQEALIVENTPDMLAGEQTWPTEEELAQAGKAQRQRVVRKRVLPRGTSDYQAAWIVEDSDHDNDAVGAAEAEGMEVASLELQPMESEGEEGEEDEDGSVISEEDRGDVGISSRVSSVWDKDDDGQSEMMDDEELTSAQRQAEIQRLKADHAADEEFPDEVDTPTDVLARQRFEKYRGLKSLRTSPWDPKESLPSEYARIFSFDNFARTQKTVLSQAKEIDLGGQEGCISVGSFVKLHVLHVPAAAAANLQNSFKSVPLVACGLLQHESKMSVLHFSVKKTEGFTDPIKSKETLIFHTGFRRYHTRPIFSTDDLNMDKHKFERFLHPGRFVVASVFAPISFPPLPLLAFRESDQGEASASLVASGSLRSVDPDRIILKKIILSGYPLRVSKRKAVVRFMFHNPEDVRWFKGDICSPLELWTKYGRRGRIKEAVGTHGSMKCVFDGVVQQRDAVCVSLFKRVYPKWPQQ